MQVWLIYLRASSGGSSNMWGAGASGPQLCPGEAFYETSDGFVKWRVGWGS